MYVLSTRKYRRKLDQLGLRYEVIFVDDGSTDGTFVELQKLHHEHPSTVHVICFRRNFGKTPALVAGFSRCRGAIVLTMDGDLQDDPAEIPRFLAKLDEGYDLVTGWKFPRLDPISKTFPCSRLKTGRSRSYNRYGTNATAACTLPGAELSLPDRRSSSGKPDLCRSPTKRGGKRDGACRRRGNLGRLAVGDVPEEILRTILVVGILPGMEEKTLISGSIFKRKSTSTASNQTGVGTTWKDRRNKPCRGSALTRACIAAIGGVSPSAHHAFQIPMQSACHSCIDCRAMLRTSFTSTRAGRAVCDERAVLKLLSYNKRPVTIILDGKETVERIGCPGLTT